MIYLDNAATSWPKPLCVRRAVETALLRFGANPGRGGHTMSLATAEQVFRVRETAARLFGLSDPARVAFTGNCTYGLNMVMAGLLRPGQRVVVSSWEHNAVMRPAAALQKRGVAVDIARVTPEDEEGTVKAFARLLTPQTGAVVCMHASNVTGEALPIRKIGALTASRGIPFVVDAAQTAGMLPLHMEEDQVDFLCMPGHKGLYGPMGTGMVLSSGQYPLTPLIRGGTGSNSASLEQPEEWPDRLESGTVNVPGILGLGAGMEWVEKQGVLRMHRQELALTRRLYSRAAALPGVQVYGALPEPLRHVPVVSLNVEGIPSEEVAARLNQDGIAVRAGLHCAPTAHRQLGTLATGTVRFSLSAFTTPQEIERVCERLEAIVAGHSRNR